MEQTPIQQQILAPSRSGGIKINSITALVIVLAASAAFAVYLWQIQKIDQVYFQNVSFAPMKNHAGTQTVGWQTYQNQEFGFEVKYPPAWEVKTTKDGNKTKIEFVGQKDSLTNLVASIGLVPNPGITLDEWWQIAKENSDYQKIGESSVAGRKALQIKVGESENRPRYLLISKDDGGSIFGLALDGLPTDIASGILASFKLIEQ